MKRALPVTVKRDLQLFDERPIKLPGFRLRARSADVVGKPTANQITNAIVFSKAAEEGSPYWLGDILAHLEDRADLSEQIDQIVAVTGLARQTVHNRTYVARHVDLPERELAPSIGHAAQVAPLERKQQTKLLQRARDEDLSVRELQLEVRHVKRPKTLDGQAVLEGMYRVIAADPPWHYGNMGTISAGAGRAAPFTKGADHYPTMKVDELCRLPVEAHALPDAVLFLWTTAPILLENPGPRELIEAWGFEPKTGMVWDKIDHNFGNYVSIRHEHLLICTRGSCLPDRVTPMVDSVQTIKRSSVHSEKPAEFYRLIERLYDGPYLELFARGPRAGWSTFGNDARLWGAQAAS